MKIIYTDTFTLTTGTLIQRGATGGNGTIPNTLCVEGVWILPVTATDQICMKGINEASNWITLRAGDGWYIDRIDESTDRLFMYFKAASGSVVVNLIAEGN